MRLVGGLVAAGIILGVICDLFLGGTNNGLGMVMYAVLVGALIRFLVVISEGEQR